ncbi:MAG: GTPase Era, partial [Bacteroidota bacterium]
NERIAFTDSLAISALQKINTGGLLEKIRERLPEGPEYYPKDQLTDRPERFFVAEIIREKILDQFHQEIPYSTEVTVESFKETQDRQNQPMVKIQAIIFAARESQKKILLGKNGSAIKKLGIESRLALEKWLEQKIFLDLHVKIRDNWRDDESLLRKFGYEG